MAPLSLRLPECFQTPVLESVIPVVEHSRNVHTHVLRINEVASWMAYEELPFPAFALPFGIGDDVEQAIDFCMVANTINFAFTDFETHTVFQVEYGGKVWSDAEALFACLKRALDEGIPLLRGSFLAAVSQVDLRRIFRGNIEIPLLKERVEILNSVGQVLDSRYSGRFFHFIESASPRLYDQGRGLIDKLVTEMPRFNDVSVYDGQEIKFYKLAQLSLWMLYTTCRPSGMFRLDDPERMTAFADYILPAALRILGIFSYSPELESTIQCHEVIPRDSAWEIEIRAHTVYATALLTEEINKRRPANRKVIIPHIDARLWTHYHTTYWPHHLTRTIMY